jgi:hypothetical protein
LTLSVETVLSVYILKERYQKNPIHKL